MEMMKISCKQQDKKWEGWLEVGWNVQQTDHWYLIQAWQITILCCHKMTDGFLALLKKPKQIILGLFNSHGTLSLSHAVTSDY